ncbi:MAG TPA: hypothetical protein VNO70_26415 [Blastocatellia bacterium]|nr:hypothetical protein [Blastocatellia bacterium]
MARNVPVETSLGFFYGRDCIFLDRVVFNAVTRTLLMEGDVNGTLCTAAPSDDFIPYALCFRGVVAYTSIDLDLSSYNWQSCFDEIVDSAWLLSLAGNVTLQHRHFVVQTYDDVFEVICEGFEFEVRQIAA